MKYILIPILVAYGSAVYADTTSARIEDHYTSIITSVPSTQTECQNVDVPVYGQKSGNAAGGALLGMVIGGISGKAITGKDNGAAAGAVIGGIIGADQAQQGRKTITGYRIERQCSEIVYYEDKRQKVYDYSTITFKVDGQKYTLRFTK